MAEVLRQIWVRFLWLSWAGKGAAVFVVLYVAAWALDNIGADGAAYQFKEKALFVLGALLIALFFRMIWRDATKR